MWSNKYIGIPYLDNGRDTAGTDCWGLVRLIYKEELSIDLPSFYTDYAVSDTDRISELMNQYREGWEQLSLPEEKCVVLFRILGKVSHIGIMLNEHQFIHNKRNQAASVESINNLKWKNRVVGFFKYNEKAGALFEALPHALKPTEITIEFNEGSTIDEAFEAVYLSEDLPEELKSRIIVYVDGKQVDKETDGQNILVSGQRIEYRLIPNDSGGDFLRTLLTVAVIVVAIQTGLYVSGQASMFGTVGMAGGTAGMGMAAQAGTMMVGMALVNAVAPVRPMDANVPSGSPDSSNPQLLLTGGRNDARQYEAIPVVLGTYKYVPPVAAVNYLSVEDDKSYLRMLLCWGYGPLYIDNSTLKVGATDFGQYLDKKIDPITSLVSASDTTVQEALKVYGTDIAQIVPNIDLVYTETGGNIPGGGDTTDAVFRVIPQSVTSASVSISFPQGLRGIWKTGPNAGSAFAVAFNFSIRVRKLDPTTLLPIDSSPAGWKAPGFSFPAVSNIPIGQGLAKVSLDSISIWTGVQNWSTLPGYTTSIVYLTKYGSVGVVSGPAATTSNATTAIVSAEYPIVGYTTNRSGTVINPVYGTTPVYTTSSTTPVLPPDSVALYTVQTYYTNVSTYSISSTSDTRASNNVTGGAITITNNGTQFVCSVASGSTSTITGDYSYGASGQPFYLRKDAFTSTISFSLDSTPAPYEIKVQRTSSDEFEFSDRYEYKKAVLFLITGYNSDVAPVTPPKNTSLVITGLNILATDQLNGSIEGINATVSSVCWDYQNTTYSITGTALSTVSGSPIVGISGGVYTSLKGKIFVGTVLTDHNGFNALPVTITNITDDGTTAYITFNTNAANTTTNYAYTISTLGWVKRTTNNPASLFRYVLQHPANAQAIADADISSKVDLPSLEAWHVYCTNNNYTYNSVIVQRRSLLEVMRDICAAGKASPQLINGKWSVVIDQPRSTIVQHFTPHNSWNFEGTRILSTPPHALRVNIISSASDYQAKELTVYSYANKVMNITTTNGSTTATVTSTTSLFPDSTFYNSNYSGTITVTAGTSIPTNTVINSISNSTTIILSAAATTTGTNSVTFHVPYTKETATVFETISLPGVTNETQAISLTKFHLAQSMLRPETYSLNTDMEHLACTRGDLVRVTHDVPMWGLSTGRIKNFIDINTIELSESVLLTAGVTYTIRIRTETGASVVRNTYTVSTTDYYNTLTLTTPITSTEGKANNLFMLGTLSSESAEMVVVAIEPSSNLTAKISLTDYAPEVYTADSRFNAIPSYKSQISNTLSFASKYITSTPIVASTAIRSDESVMSLSGSSYIYRISVPYTNPAGLDANVTDVEYRMCLTLDTSKSWRFSGIVKLSAGSILLSDVTEGQSYTIQLRYLSGSGYTGPWTTEIAHTIVGKTTQPSPVTGISTPSVEGGKLRISWNKSPEIDVVGYEVRDSDTGWGLDNAFLYSGSATTCSITPGALNAIKTYYIRAVDSTRLYSTSSATTTFTVTEPSTPTNIVSTYSVTTTGHSNVTFSWNKPTEVFATQFYRVTITKPGPIIVTADISANSWTVNADWVGTAVVSIQTMDILQHLSATPYNQNIVKIPPSMSGSIINTPTPTNNTLLLSWAAPVARTGIVWNRSGTIATVTDVAHIYETGAIINVSASSSITAIPVGLYTVTKISADTYQFPCLSGGSTSGTLTDATTSSLPISQYEVRTSDGTTILYTGSSLSYPVQSTNIAQGLNTYKIYAIDTAGKYSSAKSVTFTYTLLGGVSGTASFTAKGTALFKWSTPSQGQFAVSDYLLELTGTFSTVTANRNTTDWEVPVNWSNTTASLKITPRDILGNYGNFSIVTLQNTLLDTPAMPGVPILRGTNLELDWADNTISSTQLPVGRYEIRDSTGSATDANAGKLVWKGTESWASISLVNVTPSTNFWYIFAYDSNGKTNNIGVTYTYTDLVKPDAITTVVSSFGTNISDSTLVLTWAPQSPRFGLKHYQITYQDANAIDGLKVMTTTVLSNTINISPIPKNFATVPIPWTGDKYFDIVVVDQIGNSSDVKSQKVTKNPPDPITGYNAQVVDNNVLLSWTLPNRTTLPVDTSRIKKAPAISIGTNWNITPNDWTTGTSIGDKTGTFTTILERTGGKYTYLITAVDTDGVESTPTYITATVAQPPDYIFNGQLISNFSGTATGNASGATSVTTYINKINAQNDAAGVAMPVDLVSTWTQHYTNYKVTGGTISAGGTGYAIGDIVTLASTNATFKATFTVTNVSAGVVTAISLLGSGSYTSIPTSPATTTASGLGTGLTITVTTGTWATSQDQINAGYPIYIQPSVSSGSYSELFDFGQTFSSTKITVNTLGSVVSGAVSSYITINTSPSLIRSVTWSRANTTATLVTITDTAHGFITGNNVYINTSDDISAVPIGMYTITVTGTNTYTITGLATGTLISGNFSCNGNWLSVPYSGSSLFATNFRYVLATVNVSQTDGGHGVYRLSYLDVSLDSKAINDAGSTGSSGSAITIPYTSGGVYPSGYAIPFNVPFIDVSSINLTVGSGASAIWPIYDYKDAVLSGTYSVVSNVCTVTVTAHGFSNVCTGTQKVRLAITTGNGISNVYTVTYTGVNTFTVPMVVGNTSGSLSMYSQSIIVYVCNSSGLTSSTAPISWQVRGY